MTVEVIGVDHIFVSVGDLGRSEEFCDRVMAILGFRKDEGTIASDPHLFYYNRQFAYSLRPAREGTPGHDPYAPGLHHLCFQVVDEAAVDRAARELREAEVEATEPRYYPEYAPDYYATFFEDVHRYLPPSRYVIVVVTNQTRPVEHDECKELLMTEGVKTIMYPVTDLAKAKTLYGTLLGVEPYMEEPYYVGFNVGGQDIGLDRHGHSKGMTGPVGYWHVDDIRESLKALLDAGAEAQQEVKDVGGGKLIASVKDADGNVIGLIQSAWGQE